MLHDKFSTFLYLLLLLEFTGIPGLSPPLRLSASIYIGLSITRSRCLSFFLESVDPPPYSAIAEHIAA